MTARVDPAKDAELEGRVEAAVERALERRSRRLALLVTSGELDKLMVAATLAAGASAMDFEVEMFFAFWGLSAVRERSEYREKQPLDRLLTLMLGSGLDGLPSSRFHCMGLGARFLADVMKSKKVASLAELMAVAEEGGARLTACQMSMDVMGVTKAELRPGVRVGGVASFLVAASRSGASLTI